MTWGWYPLMASFKLLERNWYCFVSSRSGPALRVVPQGVEWQLPAAAPATGLHPAHSARPHLPTSPRQPHTLGRPPATSRPPLLSAFCTHGPPLAFAMPTAWPLGPSCSPPTAWCTTRASAWASTTGCCPPPPCSRRASSKPSFPHTPMWRHPFTQASPSAPANSVSTHTSELEPTAAAHTQPPLSRLIFLFLWSLTTVMMMMQIELYRYHGE